MLPATIAYHYNNYLDHHFLFSNKCRVVFAFSFSFRPKDKDKSSGENSKVLGLDYFPIGQNCQDNFDRTPFNHIVLATCLCHKTVDVPYAS